MLRPVSSFFDRTESQQADFRDLGAVISMSLAAHPVDTEGLRRGIWTFVLLEHHAGTSPGHVILALTQLVESARLDGLQRHTLLRQVILWCVEAYFGHLGGDLAGSPRDSVADASGAP